MRRRARLRWLRSPRAGDGDWRQEPLAYPYTGWALLLASKPRAERQKWGSGVCSPLTASRMHGWLAARAPGLKPEPGARLFRRPNAWSGVLLRRRPTKQTATQLHFSFSLDASCADADVGAWTGRSAGFSPLRMRST